MSEREWDVKCQAAFIGLYAAIKLCGAIGMDIDDMLQMLRDRLRSDGCVDANGTIIERKAHP